MISKATLFYSIFILIFASFSQQFLDFLNHIFGEYNIKLFFYISAFVFCFLIFVYSLNKALAIIKYFQLLTIFILLGLTIYLVPYFGEKTHVILYALLGYLSIKDTYSFKKNAIIASLYAVLFSSFIGILDEIFQFFLPYREGDIRDVITNLYSSSLGICLFFALGKKEQI